MDKPENKSISSDLSGNRSAGQSSPSTPSVSRASIHSARAVSPSGTSSQPGRSSGAFQQSVNRSQVRAAVGRATGSFAQSRATGSQPVVPNRSPSSSINMRLPVSADRSLIKPSPDKASGETKTPSGNLRSSASSSAQTKQPESKSDSSSTKAPEKAPNVDSAESAQPEEISNNNDEIAATVMLSSDRFDENGNPIPLEDDGSELSEEAEVDVAPVATLPTGMIIDGRYEIQGVLGTGGFATVYRAHHISLDTDVALKVMDTKKGVDATYSERFFREAKIAAKIRHNNVVTVYDYGHIPETDQPYIAMEMLHGRDLSHELEKVGPLSPKRAFILFRPVLEALSVGHKLGIVHKDLKPENLYLIDPGGTHETMKILDFGVARVNSSEVAKLTTAGQLLGTPRYLAPEYIKSQQVSPAIDVYQMALIISEALTGIPAVTGDPFHAMMLHCSGKLQISEFLLEDRLGEVFRKAIAINPEDRYPDCETFAKALDTVADLFSSNVPLQGGAPQIVPDGGMASFAELTPSGRYSGPQAMMSGSYAAPKSNKKIAIVMLIAIFLLVGVGGGIFYKFNEKAKAEAAELAQREEMAKKAAEELAAANDPDAEFEFEFKSDPEHSIVKLKNGDTICEDTPCKHIFRRAELSAGVIVVVSHDGYNTSEYPVVEGMATDQKGLVEAKLNKATDTPEKWAFRIEYSPKGATVSDENGEVAGCKLTPCAYTFDASQKMATLTFTANGYKSMNIILDEDKYKEGGKVVVNLEQIKPKTTGSGNKATVSVASDRSDEAKRLAEEKRQIEEEKRKLAEAKAKEKENKPKTTFTIANY